MLSFSYAVNPAAGWGVKAGPHGGQSNIPGPQGFTTQALKHAHESLKQAHEPLWREGRSEACYVDTQQAHCVI